MAKDLASINFKVGNNRYHIKGAKWFYNDKDIRKHCGAELTSESDTKAEGFDQKIVYQRKLVRMAMSIGKDGVGKNAAQGDAKRRYFWCHPDKVYNAMTKLKNKKLDKSFLPGKWKILKVEMPVDSNLR